VTTEANLWEWLRDVALPLGQYSRIESGDTAPGFPDVHCQLGPGASPTLELKCAKHAGARIPFTKKHGVRRSQIKWARENIRKGGVHWFVCEVSPYVHIIPGKYADKINGATDEELFVMAEVTVNRKKNEESARIFHEILLGE
jgi:hypothetical protein